jgi:hypothetical protein
MPLIECPCCGGDGMVPDIGARLTGIERDIFDIVTGSKCHGVTLDGLVDLIYGARRDGGPDDARATTRVRIWRMNKRLSEIGLRVKATNLGPGALYRVVAA